MLPLNLGHSGAEVSFRSDLFGGSVLKKCTNAREQGHFSEVLGPRVCPVIFRVHEDYYLMQKLNDWRPSSLAEGCEAILDLLEKEVWPRPAAIGGSFEEEIFFKWLSQYGDKNLSDLFLALSLSRGLPEECLTHGDPTIANGLRTQLGALRLIDPLIAKNRVPSWRVVDQGKVLQSWMGWEAVLLRSTDRRFHWEQGCPGERLAKVMDDSWSWFWLGVHCLRILPYAKNEDVHQWCLSTKNEAVRQCVTLL